MKKVTRDNILCFIMGAIIFSCITGVLAYTYSARQVSFTPSDENWKVSNVEDAINSLKNTTVMDFRNSTYARNAGIPTSPARTNKLTLDKGQYLVVSIYTNSGGSTQNINIDTDETLNLVCNNCEKNILTGRKSEVTSTAKPFANNSQYVVNSLSSTVYKVDILEDNTDISITSGLNGNYDYIAENLLLQAVEID